MIHDRIENYKLYQYGAPWEEAFEFIKKANSETQEGRYELSNGMYVSIESYETKEFDRAIFESHRKYIDIQWTISGAEAIGYSFINDLKVKIPYNEKADILFYENPEAVDYRVANYEGRFTLLFPEDAHMPKLNVQGFEKVKKGVVKIPVSLLT